MRYRKLMWSLARVIGAVAIVLFALFAALSYPDYAGSRRIAQFCGGVPVGANAAEILADAARDPELRAENREDRIVVVGLGRYKCFLWLERGRFAGRRDTGYND